MSRPNLLLHDLAADPWQVRNLIADPVHRPVARKHHQWLCDQLVREQDRYQLAPAFGATGWLNGQEIG